MRLTVLCAAALSGLLAGDLGHLDPSRLGFGGAVALLGAGLAWRRPVPRTLALLTCAAALGGLRAAVFPVAPAADTAPLEPYVGQTVRLRGVVRQPPNIGAATAQLLVEPRAVGPTGRDPPPLAAAAGTAPGATRVRVVGDPGTLGALATGDALVLEGRLLAGDARAPPSLLFPQLLGWEPASTLGLVARLAGLRAAAQAGVRRYLPEPQASLAAGVLLGGSGRLDADFRLQLQRSGLAHVVAIDGFKQVVVAAALGAVAVRALGPRLAALPILLGVAGYTLLTGAHPAAVRAGLMAGLAILAARTGRLADPLTSVAIAATIMAALEPRILFDVGLQLSLSATLGMVLLWPRLRRRFTGVPRLIGEPVGLTLAVTLATLPITLGVFQLVSLVSPVAHVLAVPLLPLVLVSTAVLALVSPVAPVASIVAWAAWLPSTLLVGVIQVFGRLPGAALSTGRLSPVAAGCLAAALLVWGLWGLPEAASLRRRLRWAYSVGPLAYRLWPPVACALSCLAVAALLRLIEPDGKLHVQHLAVSRGEAVFVRGPTGRTALVVAGRLDGVQLASQVATCLAVWEHRVDRILALDPAAQAGLGPTLVRYPPEQPVDAAVDVRVDLGGGAALDVHPSAGQPRPDVSISFGRVALPLPTSPAADLVSDGFDVWSADSGAQPALTAAIR
ncbi:MAG TPA: ComEC/Rec2 family competence protein [Chloroflexota bacterium]|nr:ComEC/Rec2 family competence protein [Chloroflexota bacterium]